jgi:hypothetical protein
MAPRPEQFQLLIPETEQREALAGEIQACFRALR